MKTLFFVLPMLLAVQALATPKPPIDPQAATPIARGLEVRGFDQADAYARFDVSSYKLFKVMPASLEFDQRWLRDQKFELRDNDRERITESFSESLTAAVTEVLTEQTELAPTDSITPGTLVIVPQLREVNITAPDTTQASRVENFVHYVGSAKIHFLLSDGPSDTLLVSLTAADKTQEYFAGGEMVRANRIRNLRDFERLFKRWSEDLAAYLNGESKK